MTKIHALSAIAVFLFAFAACQKDGGSPSSIMEPITGHASFTAGIAISADEPEDKTTIADNGRQTWHAGDQLLISNGAKTLSIANDGALSCTGCTYNSDTKQLVDNENSHVVAQWITITDAMIADEGKTLNFTTDVYEPASHYCFFVTGPTPHVYSMTTGGRVVTRTFGEVNASRDAQDAHLIAKCNKNESNVSFSNTLSYLSFNCSASYYAATFIPNSGAGQIAYKINPDLSNLEHVANTNTVMRNAGVSAVFNQDHGTWYLPLAPNYTLTGGFTFILWSNASDYSTARNLTLEEINAKDDWSGNPVFFSTPNDFTTVLGHVTSMGDISARVTFTTNSAKWDAGQTITIDGVEYSKNMTAFSGVAATLVSANQNISAPGAYFVKNGVTVTMSANIAGSVLIMGDAIEAGPVGSRGAILNTNSGKQFTAGENASVVLKGLTVNHSGNEMFNITTTGVNVVIEDCYIKTGSWKYLATIADGASLGKFSVVNSDLIVRQGVVNKLDSGSRSIETLKFSNTVLSRSEGVGSAAICQGTSTTEVTDCILAGNTFINFAHASSSYDALQLKSVDSFTATNNYFYLAASGNQVNLTSAAYNSHAISGTHSTGYTKGVKYHMGDKWPSDDTAVESQFVGLDLSAAKPDFSLNTTEYGAQR